MMAFDFIVYFFTLALRRSSLLYVVHCIFRIVWQNPPTCIENVCGIDYLPISRISLCFNSEI